MESITLKTTPGNTATRDDCPYLTTDDGRQGNHSPTKDVGGSESRGASISKGGSQSRVLSASAVKALQNAAQQEKAPLDLGGGDVWKRLSKLAELQHQGKISADTFRLRRQQLVDELTGTNLSKGGSEVGKREGGSVEGPKKDRGSAREKIAAKSGGSGNFDSSVKVPKSVQQSPPKMVSPMGKKDEKKGCVGARVISSYVLVLILSSSLQSQP